MAKQTFTHNGQKDDRKWFEVTVEETYRRTFRVLALDETQAEEIMEDAINEGIATCDKGKGYSYEREMTDTAQVDDNEFILTYESEGFYERDNDKDDDED